MKTNAEKNTKSGLKSRPEPLNTANRLTAKPSGSLPNQFRPANSSPPYFRF
jgi:hypothetical protein